MSAVCDVGFSDPRNFEFAFDNISFSDKTLWIEILPELAEDAKNGNGEGVNKILDLSLYHRKRKRSNNDSEESVSHDNRDGKDVAIEQTLTVVGLNLNHIGRSIEGSASLSSDHLTNHRVRKLHISSAILAAKSQYFYKLFANGVRGSNHKHVPLQIHASEEAAFMDLLKFMYSNRLERTSPPDLLEVLVVAEKYEVASCMSYCFRVLRNITMTTETALLYLDLPSRLSMTDDVQSLDVCAKQFLVCRYKDFSKVHSELLNLPLAGIEEVFSSNDLEIDSEDAVYDFLIKWAQTHYPELEERKKIVSTRLVRLIRFPLMTCARLNKVINSVDLDKELALKTVFVAFSFKAKTPHHQQILARDKSNPSHHLFVPRQYKCRPIKIIEFDKPNQQIVVYLDFTRKEVKTLYSGGWIHSEAFPFGGQHFILFAKVDQNSAHSFGLFLGMGKNSGASLAVEFKFATRLKGTNAFVNRTRGVVTFTGGNAWGRNDLFGMPWDEFMAEDCQHFINGILHIGAEITIQK